MLGERLLHMVEFVPFERKVKAVHFALDAAGVEHAFSGAIALAYHVIEPRATDDVDVNIGVDSSDAERVIRAMPPLVKWTGTQVRIAQAKGEVKLRWQKETAVDLFFLRNDFHRVVQERKEFYDFVGDALPFVCATDLAVFKALFNRPKDWVDIDSMLRAGTVDEEEALHWIEELGDAERFGKMVSAVRDAKVPLPQSILDR